MNREDTIKLAREAGAFPELSETPEKDIVFLRRFAALVAAAEREACAKLCEEPGWNTANWCAKQIRARGQA